jgi:site-specific DNA-methyltransferase (adenine-specific)
MAKTTVKDLKFDNRNANKHSEYGMQRLEKSIGKIGLGRSILISDDNEIIAGNGVTESAINAGIDKVRIIETDGSEIIAVKRTDIKSGSKEFYEMALSDNIIAKENIVMDVEVTNAICEEYELEEYKLESETKEVLEAEEDEFDVPEGGIETDILLGDLFEIGEHRLLCGDSTQTDTFEKLFNGQLADLVVTDPPYNVAYEGCTKEKLTIVNDKQTDDSFYQFLYDFYTALGSYTKAGGAWYVWFADVEIVNFAKAFKDSGFKLAQMLVWKKNSLVMGRKDYHFIHEPCLYGWKEGAAHGWYSDRKQTTVLNFDRPSRNAEHPTMKPIPLFAYQIGNSSKQGDIVADGFGGSGTTMVACHQMDRKAYLVEFDPKYCQVIIDRMRKLDPTLVIKRNGVILESK